MKISDFSTEKIEEIRVPWVICGICKQKRSGILHIMGSNHKLGRRLFFSEGSLQFATSNQEEDRLGRVLLSAGRITPEQFSAAMLRAAQGKRIGKVLVESGSVNQKEINYFVGMQIRNILFSTFELENGLYFFEEKPISLPKDLQLKVLVGHLILNGLRSMRNLILVFDEISKVQSMPLVQGTAPLFPLAELPLTQNEAFLYSRLDGFTTVNDLIKITSLPREMVFRFVYAGLCLEFISVREGTKSISANRFDLAFREPEKAQGSTIEKKELTLAEQNIRKKILKKYSQVENGDFWSFMELREGALKDAVRKKYIELSQEYHPDLFQESYISDLIPNLNQVISYLNLAYNTLSDPEAQKAYQNKLNKEKEEKQLSLKEKQKTAEALYRKGEYYFLDDDFFNAHRHFELALQYFPKKARFWSAKGRTEMQNPRWLDRARQSFNEAIKLDGFFDEPYVYLAKICLQENDLEQALVMVKKALEINPMNETAMNLEEEMGKTGGKSFLDKFLNKK